MERRATTPEQVLTLAIDSKAMAAGMIAVGALLFLTVWIPSIVASVDAGKVASSPTADPKTKMHAERAQVAAGVAAGFSTLAVVTLVAWGVSAVAKEKKSVTRT